MKKTCHDNTIKKKTRVAILISDKTEFRSKKFSREREGRYTAVLMCLSLRIPEAKTEKIAKRKKEIHYYSFILYPSFSN